MTSAPPRILVIDNYDSFVYTIVGYLQQLGAQTVVQRNDAVTVDVRDVAGVLISPGPGTPADAGASIDAVHACRDHAVPMLGVCLGHQVLAEVFGATVSHAPELMHGKTSLVEHRGGGVFAGVPTPVECTRYHSLAVEPATVPAELEITSWVAGTAAAPVVMGLRHRSLPLEGVQFHPESVLTQSGHLMLGNWLQEVGLPGAAELGARLAPLVRR